MYYSSLSVTVEVPPLPSVPCTIYLYQGPNKGEATPPPPPLLPISLPSPFHFRSNLTFLLRISRRRFYNRVPAPFSPISFSFTICVWQSNEREGGVGDGSSPLNSTGRHGLFLNSTGDIRLDYFKMDRNIEITVSGDIAIS